MNSETELYKEPGPILLLAGPGTGKTYQLAKRVKYLVDESHVSPENITVITFTASAAKNMDERISDPSKPELYISMEKHPGLICTMHSLGYRILREKEDLFKEGDNLRIVYSDRLRNILVSDAAQLSGFERNDGIETAKCRQFGRCDPIQDKKCKICEQYQNILRSCSSIDYDDQILLACKILSEDEEILCKYRGLCKHLLVDEYQDINAGQFKLISLLTKNQRDGFFAVGDDDQSIYSWRGGSPQFIRDFKTHFGDDAKIKHLKNSYRCRSHVLEGAISIVEKYDAERLPKEEFQYFKDAGKTIEIHNAPSDEKEASIVKDILKRVLPSRSVLILLPHRGFTRAIVRELQKSRISFSAPLTQPGEGLPLIATLSHWLNNSADNLSFRESLEAFINSPASGTAPGKSKKGNSKDLALLKISELWKPIMDKKADSLWSALELGQKEHDIYSKSYDSFARLRELYEENKDALNFITDTVKSLNPWRKVQTLLEEINLWVETSKQTDSIAQKSSVQIMTIQNAKGLEADVVCIVGLEEDTLPRKDSNSEEIKEQSRLIFVSMTRAKEELHLFHARKRSSAVVFKNVYGKGKAPDIHHSRFLDSIPKEHKEVTYHPA